MQVSENRADYLKSIEEKASLSIEPHEPSSDRVKLLQAVEQQAAQNAGERMDVKRTALFSQLDKIYGNPDKAARIKELEELTGLSAGVISRNYETIHRSEQIKNLNKNISDSPTLSRQFSDPEFAALAYDDVRNLVDIEDSLKIPTGPRASFSNTLSGLGQSFIEGAEQTRQGMRAYGARLFGFDDVLHDANKKTAASQMRDILATPDFRNETLQGLYGGGVSLLQAIPALAGGILTRSPAVGIGSIGGQTGFRELGKYEQRFSALGQDAPLQALLGGFSEGVIEAATEALPMSFVVKRLGKAGFGEFLTGLLGREMPTEQIATLLQDAVDTAIANPDKTWGEYFKERPSAAYQTALGVLVMSGAMGGVNTIVRNLANNEQMAQQAEVNTRALEALNHLVATSKLAERAPETFADFVEKAGGENGLEHIYIESDALMQSGLSDELMQLAPSIAGQISEGGLIQIPTREYLEIAKTDAANQLLDHWKTDPDGMSRAEAADYASNQRAQLESEFNKLTKEQENSDEFIQSVDVVKSNIKTMLDGTSRFTSDVNESYSSMVGQWYAVQAANLGITPEELYNRYPLTVRGQSLTGDDVFNQQPVAALVGNELGENLTSDNVVEIARNWFKANLQGKTITREGFGDVRVSGKSWRKIKNGLKVDLVKARLLPAIRGVIEHGEYHGRQDLYKPRKDDIVAFHYFTAPVDVGGKSYEVGATVAEDSFGNMFYNINQDPSALQNKRKASLLPSEIARGVKPSDSSNEPLLQSLNQPSDGINLHVLNQDTNAPRGTFSPSTLTISLLEKADLSTFLHETGHFFLEASLDIASRNDAPENLKNDAQALLDWFGVESLDTWYGLDPEIKRSYHEQFARGFEAYLFEGKAPSIELRGLFQKFRAWLINIYNDIKNLNVTLTDEVRGVMDRMLATTEQIELIEQGRSMLPLFETAEQAGMTADEFADYQKQGIQASIDAIEQLQNKSLKEMKWLHGAHSKALKALQKEAAARRREARIDAKHEIMSQPVYRAWQFLTGKVLPDDVTSAGRISLTELENEGYSIAEINELKSRRMTSRNNGVPLDYIASKFGFEGSDHLIQELLRVEPLRQAIENLTDVIMLQRHGDLSTPEALQRAADQAVHNEVRARFTAAESNALAKAIGSKRLLLSSAKGLATDVISRVRVRDLKPSKYTASETKAGKEADKAFKKGDLQKAAAEKRNQVIQQQLAKEAIAAKAEVEKTVRYLRKFNNASTRKNLDSTQLDQIDLLLDRFDLRDRTLKAIDRNTSLAAWLASTQEQNLDPDIDPYIAAEANRTNYKNLTMDQLRGLNDAVRQFEHLGRLKKKLLTAKDQRELDAIVEEITNKIIESSGGRKVDNEKRATFKSQTTHFGRWGMAIHRKAASVAREMDGFEEGGPIWEYFIRPMNMAGDKEVEMRAMAAKRLHEISKPILSGEKMGGKGRYYPTLGRSFNRGERLAFALNWGNDGNRQRMLSGRNWTADQVQPILDSLTSVEWKFVQNIWDFFESYRPEIAAKEKRIYGKEPDWVDPTAFEIQTSDGQLIQLRGGYYPIKYDPNQSGKAAEFADTEDAKSMMRAAHIATTTRRSYTKTRADEVHGRPVLLNFDGIWQGANELIHDLAWHEWAIDANRLIKRLDDPIRNHYGAQYVEVLRSAINDSVRGDVGSTNMLERSLNHVRIGSTVVGLGWNLTTAMLQPLGLSNSIVRVGGKWVMKGLSQFYGSPAYMAEKAKEVRSKSSFMESRALTMNREINDVRNRLESSSDLKLKAKSTFFILIQKLQAGVDYPTWLGAYEKAMSDPKNDEARSIALADQAVIDSQGGGQIKDLSQVQRGHPLLKLFTNFYSYFNVVMNLTTEQTKKRVHSKEYAALAGDYLLLMVLPAVMSGILRQALKGQDDEDEYVEEILSELIGYPLGMFVGARELSGAVAKIAGVDTQFSYKGPAGLRFFAEIDKLGAQIGQGEIDKALFKSANSVGGLLFHYPAGQVNRMIDGSIHLLEGKTKNPSVLLGGVPY